MRLPALLLLLFSTTALAQTSTFDTGNEGWETSGDATSPTAAWLANGGNPGGYIRVTDQSVGGTWYFQAPSKYHGAKCDAYDTYLRYDQFVSDTNNQQLFGGDPDVILFGGGLQLVFDNAVTPGLTWTHYDILLREDAGWHKTTLNGPIPTQAEFRAALANVAGIRIRGEYRAQADFGGLDNFVLESNFGFDLDGDDSSGAYDGDFLADTSCIPYSVIADFDADLFSGKPIDSVIIRILYATSDEVLELDAIPGALDVMAPDPQQLKLVNGGAADASDFLQAIQLMHYSDLSPNPVRGERLIEFRVYTVCGEVAIRYAYLPIYPPPNTGLPGDTTVCAGSPSFDLFGLLGGTPEPGGYWQPQLPGAGGLFDPQKDPAGTYAYIVPPAGACPGDTTAVGINIIQPFQLGNDTTICYDELLTLAVPPGLTDWQWSDGSNRPDLRVATPGTYGLSGNIGACSFADSVRVDFYTCKACAFYTPNVFSPNDDGVNDIWQVFLPCAWQQFRLEVYDRWGSLVFTSDDPEKGWDGRTQGRQPLQGVYVWRLEWTGELFGVPKTYSKEGDVTVLR